MNNTDLVGTDYSNARELGYTYTTNILWGSSLQDKYDTYIDYPIRSPMRHSACFLFEH